jgi:uncharacterized protein (DUF2141 family)
MKKSIRLLLICLLVIFSYQLHAQTSALTISVSHIRNDKGFILMSVYRAAQGYPDDPAKAFRTEKVKIENQRAVVTLANLPSGEYAVALLHDENDNQKMDKRFGLPKEGYGFSNNVMGFMGPPCFSRAAVRCAGSQSIVVNMRY